MSWSLDTLIKAANYVERQAQLGVLGSGGSTLSSSSSSSSTSSSPSTSSLLLSDGTANSSPHHHSTRNALVNNNNSISNQISNYHNHNNNISHSTNLNHNNVINQTSTTTATSNGRKRHHHVNYRGKSTSPISPVAAVTATVAANSSSTTSLLLTNGGIVGNGINVNHVAAIGIGANMGSNSSNSNNNSHSLGGQVANIQEFHTRNQYRGDSISASQQLISIDGRKSEEPCRNGEHSKTSLSPPPPTIPSQPLSYLSISVSSSNNNENGSSDNRSSATSRAQDAQISDHNNHHHYQVATVAAQSVTGGCNGSDSLLMQPHINSRINTGSSNRVEITSSSKCMPNDQVLQLLSTITSNSRLLVSQHHNNHNLHHNQSPPSQSHIPYAPPPPLKLKKATPLTPPPTSSRKLVELTRTRSSSLSSTNFTANVANGSTTSLAATTGGGLSSATIVAATTPSDVTTVVSSLHRIPNLPNGVGGNGATILTNSSTEDSSQSSLNLSSSGYLSGSSANSSVGVSSSSSNLNLSNSSTSSLTSSSAAVAAAAGGLVNLNGVTTLNEHLLSGGQVTAAQATSAGRRRTTSTNSTGAGTREVHNILEKHRRAHLKECFEQLKNQLQLHDEEKKKTSNLAILGAAYRHVMSLKRKERELEQQVEQLAKEKINNQKRILSLKRELSAKHDNIDLSSVLPDSDIGTIQGERDSLSDTNSSTRGSARYSSSSSLSSATTVPSPLGSGSGSMIQMGIPTRTVSPPVNIPAASLHTPHSPSNRHHHHHQQHHLHQHLVKSISPISSIGNSVPLPLTTKPRGSPTPSTPSPSSSSMNGIPPSSPMVSSSASPSASSTSSLSASPPINIPQSPLGLSPTALTSGPISLKIPHVPNGVKVTAPGSIISSSSTTFQQHNPPSSSPLTATISPLTTAASIKSLTSPPVLNYTCDNTSILSPTPNVTTLTAAGLQLTASPPHVQILHAPKDLTGKNGICRKSGIDHHEQSIIATPIMATQPVSLAQQQQSVATVRPSEIIVTNNASTTTSLTTKDKIPVNLFNGITLPAHTGLVLGQLNLAGLRMLGQGGLATIGVSTQHVPSSRNNSSSPPTSTVIPASGQQLHSLLVGGTAVSSAAGATNGNATTASIVTRVPAEATTRLPGGAEVNRIPNNSIPRNGDVIVNNRITVNGGEGVTTNGRTVVMTPMLVSQTQPVSTMAQLIGSSSLAGSVNLSVGGQLINTQYLSSVKPMVVAVTNNQTPPTLSSVPATATSVAVATVAANGTIS